MNREREKKAYDLSERLFQFAVMISRIAEKLPHTIAGRRVADQLFKAGTSAGANYEEAVAAESRNDFIHKLRISLKELRESRFWLRLAHARNMHGKETLVKAATEADELAKIIGKSIHTAKQKSRDK